LSYANITEINSKYIEVLGLVNELEYEKEELENKLNDAMNFIKEINLEKNNKETIITEIEALKKNSDTKVDEMHGEMIKYKKYLEKTKNDLTLISEVNGSMEIAPTFLNDSIINTNQEKEIIFTNDQKQQDIDFIKITDEIEINNDICIETEKDSYLKCHKTERESTYPSTMLNNGARTASLSESNFIISLNNNNTRDLLGNISNDQVILKNQAVEELISKLKGYSEKYPEIANVVHEFNERINIENKRNSREISNSNNKSKCSETSNNSRNSQSEVSEELQKSKESYKETVLSNLNNKVDKVSYR
jgi:hypothetical protein